MDKIFKTMALFVGSREAEQCRSHHQKMEKKYNSICKILANLRRQHYHSEEEQLLLEDLHVNNIDVIDEILPSCYLQSSPFNGLDFHLEHSSEDEMKMEEERKE